MGIQIFITRQPVAARGVVARQITYKEMWLKVSARVDALTGELEAANKQIDRLVADNLNQLERIIALWDMYQTAASKVNTQNCTEATQKPTDGVVASVSATSAIESNLGGIAQAGKANSDCANPTDERIIDLFQELSAVSYIPTIRTEMIDIVRNWVSGK